MSKQLADIQNRLKVLEQLILKNNQSTGIFLPDEESFGDWISEDQIIILTGLGRTSLYNLRKKNLVTSSKIGINGKKTYYRKSDFEKILNKNEGQQ